MLNVLSATRNQADDPLKLDEVRKVLKAVFLQQEEIRQVIKTHVKDKDAQEQLLYQLAEILPERETAIFNKNHGRDPCAMMLLAVYKIMITTLESINGNWKPGSFRSVLDMMEIVCHRVFQAKREVRDAALLNIALELKRPYLMQATMPINGLEVCSMCGHSLIDYPDLNHGVKDRNQKKLDAYTLKCNEVDKEKQTNVASTLVSF